MSITKIIVMLSLLWALCSLPFIAMGIPEEGSLVLGAITGIIVLVCLANKDNEDSTPQNNRQSALYKETTPSRVTRYSALDEDDDDENGFDFEEMTMLDMMDGKLDGKFDIFK